MISAFQLRQSADNLEVLIHYLIIYGNIILLDDVEDHLVEVEHRLIRLNITELVKSRKPIIIC